MTNDPVLFARDTLHLVPTPQQAEFLTALAEPGSRVAVRSGHGTGKSTALAAAALWFLATRPEALVPCTAPTAHQLQDVLWREMRRLIANMDDDFRSLFQTTSDRITRKDAPGMIVARTARAENPDALQGFHAADILFVIDEAAGVNDAIFAVARGALSTPSARVAMTGNPTRLTGYFHSAFHAARGSWTRIIFSCLDSPLVSPDYARDMAAEFGADSDVYRVRVLGEFPKSGMFNLISLDAVEAAMARVVVPGQNAHAPLVLGVDPAWLGGDRSAVMARQATAAWKVFSVRGADTVRLTEMVARKAAEMKPDAIIVDQTGVGAGVLDQLRLTRHPVSGVSFAETPLEPERFLNRRAELWWLLREWLARGGTLEANADLRDDLIAPEYYLTASGKIQLETKDAMRRRGLASPDLADALALTFARTVSARRDDPAAAAATPAYNAYAWMQRT